MSARVPALGVCALGFDDRASEVVSEITSGAFVVDRDESEHCHGEHEEREQREEAVERDPAGECLATHLGVPPLHVAGPVDGAADHVWMVEAILRKDQGL